MDMEMVTHAVTIALSFGVGLPILIHALYDTSVFLLNGPYAADVVLSELPGFVGNITFTAFLIEMSAFILFLIFGRKLLKNETTGWQQG